MDFEAIRSADAQYVAQTYTRFPVALVRGQGARCWDAQGKEFVDLTSGIGVNALGFADLDWANAVYSQLTTLQHTSNLFYTQPATELAQVLCERAGLRRAFFANSGAEANEGAIKAARKYGHARRGSDCHRIVTLRQSFHGRTITTLTATGQPRFHTQFNPFTPGFAYAPPDDLAATLALLDADTCAVMVELVQGEGGVRPLDIAYAQGLAVACAQRDILLIVDEVQTGVGRTGALFAFQRYGITPDIVTCAKGLGAGLPIGAVLFGQKTQDVLAAGEHAATFGGNPACCAGALAVLARMDAAFLNQVEAKGGLIRQRLQGMPHVSGIDGMGLMLGVTLDGIAPADAVRAGIAQGVLTLTAGDRLRLLPPLIISPQDIDEAMTRLHTALKEVTPA
ncbi:MAG: acetylornithine/succinylornithine family transaminase [Oscillospiraceae bacterium]|nr:acetylornithine/succinylornithine family transaminase [Oscillospiraceae bacterium]